MDEKQKSGPGTPESSSLEFDNICRLPAAPSRMAPEPHVIHRIPPEAVCHRPPAPRGPDRPPFCPRAPRPQQELHYIPPETLCHLPAAPCHEAPPIVVSIKQQVNEDVEQLHSCFPQPGPPCRLPPPDPCPIRPLDSNPVLRDTTTSEEKELEGQKTELEKQKAEFDKLKQQLQGKQVVFSASLLADGEATIGPFSSHIPLVFKHVVTNIGNAYNPHTGVFTAPQRVVYHFEWYIAQYGDPSHATGVDLMKNSERVFMASEQNPSGFGSSSNGVNLVLEVGDTTFLHLWNNTTLFDNTSHHTTFSGHLLFPTSLQL